LIYRPFPTGHHQKTGARTIDINPIYPDLEGKHVLITGGAGGIGAAVVKAFVQQRCRISVLDKDIEAGERLADRIESPSALVDQIHFHHVELTNEDDLVAVLDQAQEEFGPVSVLINNAGWDPRYSITEMTTEQWDSLFKLNVGHYFLTCRQLIPAMRDNGGGSIIMTASCQFWIAAARLACYTATKAAIMGFVKSLAMEVGGDGIRVNGVAPGWVMTERQLKEMVTPEIQKKLLDEWQALPFFLTPQLLAPAYVFLASDASKAITRQTLLVDAGWAQS